MLENKIMRIVKSNEKEIKKEIMNNAIEGFKVAVYYNMDDEKIHADTVSAGTRMADNEIVLNYIDANWIDDDDFDEDEFLLFWDVVDELLFFNELERKGGE